MNRTGQSKLEANERGQTDEGQWAWQAKNGQQAHSPQNRQLQADTAGGLSARLRPQNKRPPVGRLRSKNTAADDDGWPSAVQVSGGECSGTSSHEGGCRPTYTVPTPPIAFACHCPYPLP